MELRNSKKTSIVITSIFPPTEAIMAFSKMNDYDLVVAGDKKTPDDWQCDNVSYLSVQAQQEVGEHLKAVLPYNHYGRKMMGYLHAIASGAEYIVDTDDDNIPKEGWTFPAFEGSFDTIKEGRGFINIYQLYTDAPIWPRGLPLHLITKKFSLEKEINTRKIKVGMWQGLADEDPDVDAIYRLTSDTPIYFKRREPVVLGKGTICPFNTQNTLVQKKFFPLMYLPAYVTFRFTDILRSLVAQPIMWLYDYHLGFIDATVTQKRNPHDYFKDFISEIPMYLHAANVVEITEAAITASQSLHDNLYSAYEALLKHKIVEQKEMEVLDAWLKDVS